MPSEHNCTMKILLVTGLFSLVFAVLQLGMIGTDAIFGKIWRWTLLVLLLRLPPIEILLSLPQQHKSCCIRQHSFEVLREDAALMGMDNMIVEVVVEDCDQISHDVHSNL